MAVKQAKFNIGAARLCCAVLAPLIGSRDLRADLRPTSTRIPSADAEKQTRLQAARTLSAQGPCAPVDNSNEENNTPSRSLN